VRSGAVFAENEVFRAIAVHVTGRAGDACNAELLIDKSPYENHSGNLLQPFNAFY